MNVDATSDTIIPTPESTPVNEPSKQFDLNTIKEQLTKLLNIRVDKGATEEEAMSAAGRVQALLERYNLTMFDVEAHTPKPRGRISRAFVELGKTGFRWKKDLANILAKYNYCMILERGSTLTIIGTEENREVLVGLFDFLVDFISNMSKAEGARYRADPRNPHMDPLRWHVSFSAGVVYRLNDRLWEARQGQLQASRNSQALIVLHDEAIQEFVQQTYPKLRVIKVKATQDATAWQHGYIKGDTVPMSDRTPIQNGGNQ